MTIAGWCGGSRKRSTSTCALTPPERALGTKSLDGTGDFEGVADSSWDEQLGAATGAWQAFCRTLEATGVEALTKTLTHDEVDLAEGLRHMARMVQLVGISSLENKDTAHPYLWTALDPHRKMGGDNPQGLYLSGPINGTDTFRLSGTRGTARWLSIIVSQSGPAPFGSPSCSCPTCRSDQTERSRC